MTQLTEELLEKIRNNKTGSQLDLSGNNIGDGGVRALANALENNNTLSQINLAGNNIGDGGVIALANVLGNNKTLSQINLAGNNIGDGGVKALADALKNNDTLSQINLAGNNIGDGGVKALASVLLINQTLSQIDLSGNKIGDGGVIAFASVLGNNQTLSQINLAGNKIGDGGVKALADALKNNDTLSQINLAGNNIGDGGVKALADALKNNDTLSQINLAGNNIGDRGVEALASVLGNNQTLSQINLAGNNIGDEGATTLADALVDNQTLSQINLAENNIGDRGVEALANALALNQTLSQIDLVGNDIGNEGATALANLLELNQTLIKLSLDENKISDKSILATIKKGLARNLEHANQRAINDLILVNIELRTLLNEEIQKKNHLEEKAHTPPPSSQDTLPLEAQRQERIQKPEDQVEAQDTLPLEAQRQERIQKPEDQVEAQDTQPLEAQRRERIQKPEDQVKANEESLQRQEILRQQLKAQAESLAQLKAQLKLLIQQMNAQTAAMEEKEITSRSENQTSINEINARLSENQTSINEINARLEPRLSENQTSINNLTARLESIETYLVGLQTYLKQVATPLENLFSDQKARDIWKKREEALEAHPNWLACHQAIRTHCFHLLLTLITLASKEFKKNPSGKIQFANWLGGLHPGLGLLSGLINAHEDQRATTNARAVTHDYLGSTRAIEQLSLHFAYQVTVSYRKHIAFLHKDQIPRFAEMVGTWLFIGLKNVPHQSPIYQHPIAIGTDLPIENIDALAFRFRLLLLEINSPRSGVLEATGRKSSQLLNILNKITDIPTFTNAKLMTTDEKTNQGKHKRQRGKSMRPWTERVLQHAGIEWYPDPVGNPNDVMRFRSSEALTTKIEKYGYMTFTEALGCDASLFEHLRKHYNLTMDNVPSLSNPAFAQLGNEIDTKKPLGCFIIQPDATELDKQPTFHASQQFFLPAASLSPSCDEFKQQDEVTKEQQDAENRTNRVSFFLPRPSQAQTDNASATQPVSDSNTHTDHNNNRAPGF